MKNLTFTIILALIASIGFAQPRKIPFEKYGVAEGLPEEVGYNFIQDQQGFIWIGTQNGLVKFDGYKMKVYRYNLNNPNAIHLRNLNGGLLLAQDGKIWIGGVLKSGGFSSFDPMTEKFTNYPIDVNDSTKVPYPTCSLLFEDIAKNIWFNSISTDGEGQLLCKFNPNTNQVSRYPFKVARRFNTIVLNFQMAESKLDSSIWLKTTDDRLMRYDRKKNFFELIFQNGDNLPGTAIIDSIIDVIPAGKSGLIPLANYKHLYLFDPIQRKVIETYTFSRQKGGSPYGAEFEDEYGNFWVSAGDMLTKINREQKQKVDFKFGKGILNFKIQGEVNQIQPKFQNHNFIFFQVLSRNKQNQLFYSTLRYNFNSGTFDFFDEQFNDPENQIIDYGIRRNYMIDKTGILWFGTRPGIYKQSPKTRQITHYKHNSKDALTLPSDTILTLFEDSKQRLWVCTGRGIALKIEDEKFKRIKVFEDSEANPLAQFISCIIEDTHHQIWVGTNKGLFRWSEANNSFQKFSLISNKEFNIQTIIEDSKGHLWISVIGKGVYIYDPFKNALVKKFEPQNKAVHGLTSKTIYGFYKDNTNQIWLGDPLENDYGLFRYMENEERFIHYHTIQGDSTSISSNEIRFIAEDDLGRIWVGTDGGLNLYDREKDIFLRNNDWINLPSISSYARSSNGKMWFTAYSGGGLALVGPRVNDVKMFGEEKGLLHNDISLGGQIAMDNFGNLWLPTGRGLSVFDTISQTFTSYFEQDGFQKYDQLTCVLKTKNGDIWIGGLDGLNRIVPAQLAEKDTTIPAVLITSMTIEDSSFTSPDGKVFTKAVSYTKEIELKYWQKDVTFDFVALHYLLPEENQYMWTLEGYDKEWTKPSKARKASYTNLSPGEYIFRVKASNADGVWNEEGTLIRMTILPPWWLTWWAYIGYALLFIFAIRSFSLWRLRHLRLEKEHLQTKVEERTSELKKSLEDLKSAQAQLVFSEKMASLGELTAGIAHEIQNPLNFVNNFSEVSKELVGEMNDELEEGSRQYAAGSSQSGEEKLKLAKIIAQDIKQNLEKIHHHGKRAESIVKGMLLHSRGNSGYKEPIDINALCDEYLRLAYHGFRAKDKSFNAVYKTEFDPNLPKINVVPQDIGRVLLNLINNAFYAAPLPSRSEFGTGSAGGFKDPNYIHKPMVTVKTSFLPPAGGMRGAVVVSVSDNGPGIPDSIKDKIFQPFFTTKPAGQGTGLGLSLAYDIVKAHGGELKVETKDGEGSEFIIQIPIN
jgi:signal transduction histidine kinase/streptogramin lyase